MVSDHISIAVPFTIQSILGSNQTQVTLFFFFFAYIYRQRVFGPFTYMQSRNQPTRLHSNFDWSGQFGDPYLHAHNRLSL